MQRVDEYRLLILPVLKRYLIKHAAFFGSLTTGTMTADSDVDLLIEPENGFTLFKLLQLEQEISELINRKVDLVEYSALKASIKDEVLISSISIL